MSHVTSAVSPRISYSAEDVHVTTLVYLPSTSSPFRFQVLAASELASNPHLVFIRSRSISIYSTRDREREKNANKKKRDQEER